MLSGGLLKVTDASSATPDFVFDAIAEMTPLQKVTTIEDFKMRPYSLLLIDLVQ